MQQKDKLYKPIMEERHADKDYERNLSHITCLPARKLPEDQKTPKYPQNQCNPVAIDTFSTDSVTKESM